MSDGTAAPAAAPAAPASTSAPATSFTVGHGQATSNAVSAPQVGNSQIIETSEQPQPAPQYGDGGQGTYRLDPAHAGGDSMKAAAQAWIQDHVSDYMKAAGGSPLDRDFKSVNNFLHAGGPKPAFLNAAPDAQGNAPSAPQGFSPSGAILDAAGNDAVASNLVPAAMDDAGREHIEMISRIHGVSPQDAGFIGKYAQGLGLSLEEGKTVASALGQIFSVDRSQNAEMLGALPQADIAVYAEFAAEQFGSNEKFAEISDQARRYLAHVGKLEALDAAGITESACAFSPKILTLLSSRCVALGL